ncbi:MAG: hypothetical protein ACRCY4_00700 [Brevinema sp.]
MTGNKFYSILWLLLATFLFSGCSLSVLSPMSASELLPEEDTPLVDNDSNGGDNNGSGGDEDNTPLVRDLVEKLGTAQWVQKTREDVLIHPITPTTGDNSFIMRYQAGTDATMTEYTLTLVEKVAEGAYVYLAKGTGRYDNTYTVYRIDKFDTHGLLFQAGVRDFSSARDVARHPLAYDTDTKIFRTDVTVFPETSSTELADFLAKSWVFIRNRSDGLGTEREVWFEGTTRDQTLHIRTKEQSTTRNSVYTFIKSKGVPGYDSYRGLYRRPIDSEYLSHFSLYILIDTPQGDVSYEVRFANHGTLKDALEAFDNSMTGIDNSLRHKGSVR